jgi:hypothetical protein
MAHHPGARDILTRKWLRRGGEGADDLRGKGKDERNKSEENCGNWGA